MKQQPTIIEEPTNSPEYRIDMIMPMQTSRINFCFEGLKVGFVPKSR
jgi:hypothetical protein